MGILSCNTNAVLSARHYVSRVCKIFYMQKQSGTKYKVRSRNPRLGLQQPHVFSDSVRLQIANLELISHNRRSCYDINRKPRDVSYYPSFLRISCALYSRPFAKKPTWVICDVNCSAWDVRKKKSYCGKILFATINTYTVCGYVKYTRNLSLLSFEINDLIAKFLLIEYAHPLHL